VIKVGSQKGDLTPVALFAYNRPDHLKRTINSLRTNPLAARTPLVVFSDAPNRSEHADGVQAVRTYLSSVTGFKSVRVVERARNFGLAASVIDGVTTLCSEWGRVIAVEDDLVLAPGFLSFMNGALDCYEKSEKVMQVSGYMFPVKHPERLPEIFFTRLPTSWGWATWDRSWSTFNDDAAALWAAIKRSGRGADFDVNGSYDYLDMLRMQAQGKFDSWAIRWYASMFLAHGQCVRPARSLVHNAGFDNTGVHCGDSTLFDVELTDLAPDQWPDKVEECRVAIDSMEEFFLSFRPSWVKRIAHVLRRRLARVTQSSSA
jgi:Glycosyl transferase family 2